MATEKKDSPIAYQFQLGARPQSAPPAGRETERTKGAGFSFGEQPEKQRLTGDQEEALRSISSLLLTLGKGILAADENSGQLGKWLKEVNLENTSDIRRKYRQLAKMKGNMDLKESQALLAYEQVERLLYVMNEEIDVHGRGNFPTLRLSLSALIKRIRHSLHGRGLKVKEVKMNGGAASYILATRELPYTDIDLIFDGVDLSQANHFDLVKDAVLEALIHFMPASTNKSRITLSAMRDAYVKKMVKVCDRDLWSLLSLNNDHGRFIELKFVDRMRRQFQFSVDSFQIHLDSLVAFDEHIRRRPSTDESEPCSNAVGEDKARSNHQRRQRIRISPNFYPSVVAESVYGNFEAALSHLNDMLIDTTEPELIRGGGLLKYCQLLSRGYRPVDATQCRTWERYMCSRFFIDFPNVAEQQRKLQTYMDNHFRGDCQAKYEYLLLLYRVVDDSTVCLMNHERRSTLSMIDQLAYDVTIEIYYQEQTRRAMAAVAACCNQSSSPDSLSTACSCAGSRPCSRCPTPSQRTSRRLSSESTPAKRSTQTRLLSTPCSKVELVLAEEAKLGDGMTTPVCCEQCQNHQPKQTLLYVPPDGSYWITVA